MPNRWTHEEMVDWCDTLNEQEAQMVLLIGQLLHAMGYTKHQALEIVRDERDRALAGIPVHSTAVS